MIICTNVELWRKWLPHANLDRLPEAAQAAAERFHVHGLTTRLDPGRDFARGLERPYIYFATDEYFGNEPAFREAADVLLEGLAPR